MATSKYPHFHYLVMLLLTGIFAIGFSYCSSVPLTGRKQVNLVSDGQILAASAQQYQSFIAQAPQSRDRAQTARIREIGTRIARATESYMKQMGLGSEVNNFHWEFNLIAQDVANAFCMPGGKIVVFEGLLRYASTDAELATVMAHEVAHAVAKHSNERMSQQLLRQYGGAILGAALSNKSAAMQEIAGQVYGIGSQVFVMLPYSRTQEYEADKLGLYLMALAGYTPSSAISFWQKMAAKDSNPNASDIMSTHPSDTKRIKAIKEELPRVAEFMNGQTSPKPSSKKHPEGQRGTIITHY